MARAAYVVASREVGVANSIEAAPARWRAALEFAAAIRAAPALRVDLGNPAISGAFRGLYVSSVTNALCRLGTGGTTVRMRSSWVSSALIRSTPSLRFRASCSIRSKRNDGVLRGGGLEINELRIRPYAPPPTYPSGKWCVRNGEFSRQPRDRGLAYVQRSAGAAWIAAAKSAQPASADARLEVPMAARDLCERRGSLAGEPFAEAIQPPPARHSSTMPTPYANEADERQDSIA
jgi:hypothetical protein